MSTQRAEGQALPPLGGYQQVGGQRLWLHRRGGGAPAVVLLPGAGALGLDYWNVQDRAAEVTTSVLYDRAGTGWSDRVELPRTLAQVTDEMRELLRAADLRPPYLLVGHSLGGMYGRYYATRFPAEVTGLVLLDPAHEDYRSHMPRELVERLEAWDPDQALPNELPEELLELYRRLFAQEMADWPATIRESLIERHVSPDQIRVGLEEAKNIEQLNDEMRHAGPLPGVPLIILSSTTVDGFKAAVSAGQSDELLRQEIEGKHRLYAQLAESVPRGELRLVDAGHVTLHLRHPEAVQQAIQELLGRSS
jgi:pimeloyl-ACP methyl ester carboxylesterase